MNKDRILGFFSGDLLVTLFTLGAGDVIKTIVLGFIGGFIGVFGKDVYYMIKKFLFDRWKKELDDE